MAYRSLKKRINLYSAKLIFLTAFLVSLALSNVNAIPTASDYNNWKQIGPAGGTVGDFVFSPNFSGDSTVFAGYDPGGFFVSTDGGMTWVRRLTGLTDSNINAIELSHNFGADNSLFAGTDSGMFRSPNRGSSWSQVGGGLPAGQIEAIETVNSNTIFAGFGGQGIYKSSDNGNIWEQVNTGLTNLNVTSLLAPPGFEATPVIFAGTDGGGMFRSTDGGTNWSAVNEGLTNLQVTDLSISGSNVFISTKNGVFECDSEIATWSSIGLSGRDVSDIEVKVGQIYAAADDGFYNFPGTVWSKIQAPGTSYRGQVFIELSPENDLNNTIFAGVNSELFKKTNTADWTRSDNGIFAHSVKDIAVLSNNIFAATETGVLRSDDGGATWTSKSSGLTSIPNSIQLAPNFVSNNTVFGGTEGGGIFISTDRGDNWTVRNNGLSNLNINDIAIAPDFETSNTLFAATPEGLFKSENAGSSWTASNNGLTSLNITDIDPAVLFDGVGGKWYVSTGDGAFKSADGGNSWQQFALDGVFTANIELNAGDNEIFIHAVDIAGPTSQIIRSQNGGSTWTEIPNVPQPVTDMQAFSNFGGSLFVTTDDLVYKYGFDKWGFAPSWGDLGTTLNPEGGPVKFLEGTEQEGLNFIDLYIGRPGNSISHMKHDKTPPVTNLTGNSPNSKGWHKSVQLIGMSANEPATTYHSWNSPGPWTPGSSATTPIGKNRLYFCSSDIAGNDENTRWGDYWVDPNGPSTLFGSTLREAGAHIRNNFNFPVTASDPLSGMSRVDIICNGTIVGSDTSSPFSPVINTRLWGGGRHILRARATDNAGNTSLTATRTFFFDNIAPKVSKTSVSPSAPPRGSKAKLNFRLDDVTSPKVNATLEIFKGTTRKGKYVLGGCRKGSILSKEVTVPSVPGNYTFRTTATDYAGNKTVKNFNFTVR